MKKRLVAIVLVMLLAFPGGMVLANQNYSEIALAYLTETYNVPAERIQLFEGGTMALEAISESFWYAKFNINPEGSVTEGGVKPLPGDTPVSDRGELTILPFSPDGSIYGGVYIRLKTGEILELEQMEAYYLADREKAAAEWERLQKEAGKLDVYLYQKLQTTSEKVKVAIFPVFKETAELRERYEDLKAQYPKHTLGMPSLQEMFGFNGYSVRTLPGVMEVPEPMDLPEGIEIDSKPTPEIRPLPAEEGASGGGQGSVEPYPGRDDISRVAPDEEYWRLYEEFAQKLEAIRLDGIAASIGEITAALDDRGIAYEIRDAVIVAEMTAAEIQAVADLAAVASIHEDMIFTTMDELLRSGAEAAPAIAQDADGVASARSFFWIIIPAACLAAALAFYLAKRRTSHAK